MSLDHEIRAHSESASRPVASARRRNRVAFSVIICAYTDQRWDDVLAAVRSVDEQRYPALETILVVDHNPLLHTRLLAALPHVTVVENAQAQGLSGSKNTGIAVSHGDVIAFLDDDATAEPDWLAAMAPSYERPEIAGVGGLTRPRWETGRPRWFPEEFDWVVGCTYTGREPGAVRNLLGGNASFRRSVFEMVGGFPTGLGRNSTTTRPLGAEETEFCIRVLQKAPGSVFLYEPESVIYHRAPVARERFSYFRARCYAEGLSKAAMIRTVGASQGLSTEREYTMITLRRAVLREVRQGFSGDFGGVARAGAIVVGLAMTVWGFTVGSISGGVTLRRSRPTAG